jgi:ubiquinone/menaquinone biosynthesis C-methylase UbiE
MKGKPDNNQPEQEYVFSYDSDFTLSYHASRTAETHAFWFLPYLQPGMMLLDVGCASGSITNGLAKAVKPGQVTGIDISAKEIERARQRAIEDDAENVQFEAGDAYQLSFSDNSFDALFSHNVLEHIPEPSKALQEMRRVLKPGGIIGVRDIDFGGILTAPDKDGMLEHSNLVGRTRWLNRGAHPDIGRKLGRFLIEAGFVEVKMSASYQVFNDPDSCRYWAKLAKSRFAEPEYVNQMKESRLAHAEELNAWSKAWQDWSKLPGAFHARSHCEAIGRKP